MMPMFPLGTVLFPGAVLPLHVFEPRYREMVRQCLDSTEHEFGVVLIERGAEVGGGDFRSMFGTVARMLQVAEMDDGRYALVTVGTRRIRINAWVPDDPYPLADVDDWPDVDNDGPELEQRVHTVAARVRRINALASELGDPHADATTEISEDPLVASYHLAALAPIGPADQQRLLAATGPRERVDMLDAALDDIEAMMQFRLNHPSNESREQDADDLEGP
jgi:uncharacterized protein